MPGLRPGPIAGAQNATIPAGEQHFPFPDTELEARSEECEEGGKWGGEGWRPMQKSEVHIKVSFSGAGKTHGT